MKREAFAFLLILSFLFSLGVSRQDNPSAPVPTKITHRAVTSTSVTPVTPIDQSEFECLRKNVYFEARNESLRGMQAVALVTVNRTQNRHYPDTICGVVEQAVVMKSGRRICQFSWMCDGKADVPKLTIRVGKGKKARLVPNVAEIRAWELADRVAREVMEGKLHNFLGQATHYHATYVSPSWAKAKRFQQLTRIGAHIFYKDKGLWRGA